MTIYRADFNQYDQEWRIYQLGADSRPVTNSMFKGKDAEADVRKIVKAVNEYDRLQAINAELLAALEHYAHCSDGCTCGDGWSHDVARAAIAKAA